MYEIPVYVLFHTYPGTHLRNLAQLLTLGGLEE